MGYLPTKILRKMSPNKMFEISGKSMIVFMFVTLLNVTAEAQTANRTDYGFRTAFLHTEYTKSAEYFGPGPSSDFSLVYERGKTSGFWRTAWHAGVLHDNHTTSRNAVLRFSPDAIAAWREIDRAGKWVAVAGMTYMRLHNPDDAVWLPVVFARADLVLVPGKMTQESFGTYEIRSGTQVVHAASMKRIDQWNRRVNPFLTAGIEHVFRKKKRIQIPVQAGYRFALLGAYREKEAYYSENQGAAQYGVAEKQSVARFLTVGLRLSDKR
jgi:hypothetical protein